MNAKERGRRRFLRDGTVLAGLAVETIRSASGQTPEPRNPEIHPKDNRAYGERSHFVTSVRMGREGPSDGRVVSPLQDSIGIITASSLHFFNSRDHDSPDIDPQKHRLMIHGMVDHPLMFTMDDLKRLPSVSRIHFIECTGNSRNALWQKNSQTAQEIHGLTSCTEWTGVPLSLLLREAGLRKGATWLVAEGADKIKLTTSILVDKAMDDVLVAYGQNGEPLRPEQGFPLRLVVPGWEGHINTKWLRRIKLVDEPYMTKDEISGYPSLRPDGKTRWFQFEMGPKSVITRPSGGQQLSSRGFYEITGLAWSGGGSIRRVEISTDGGRNWKDAQLQEPIHRIAHTRFRFGWTWNGEESMLQSRCTDDRGQVQPTLQELSKIWGVNMEYWRTTTNHINHFNPIFPWKVSRDGSVFNAL